MARLQVVPPTKLVVARQGQCSQCVDHLLLSLQTVPLGCCERVVAVTSRGRLAGPLSATTTSCDAPQEEARCRRSGPVQHPLHQALWQLVLLQCVFCACKPGCATAADRAVRTGHLFPTCVTTKVPAFAAGQGASEVKLVCAP